MPFKQVKQILKLLAKKCLFECLRVIYLESRVKNARMTDTCFCVILIQLCHDFDTENSLEALAHRVR